MQGTTAAEVKKMRILIGTDGSSFSKAAIDECCKLFKPEDAQILIVSAYEDAAPIAAEPFAISAEYYQKLEDAVHEQAEDFVDEAEKQLKGLCSGKELNVTKMVVCGAPDQQLIEIAKDWNADLIIVGSHGRGFWGRLLGSVSTGVIHHAPCSVLVVRTPAVDEN
jgi:nucleotide-binding universal stress UspA family protein